MAKTHDRRNTVIVILLAVIYVIVAMSDNLKGILVPTFKDNFGVDDRGISVLLMSAMLSYAIFQFFSGLLIERLGFKRCLYMGAAIGSGSLLIIMTSRSFIQLVCGMFLLNTGMALFNVVVNSLGPILHVASTAVVMNVIHGCYSGGNGLIQFVSGKLLARNVPWPYLYGAMLVGLVIVFIILIPTPISYKAGGESEPLDRSTRRAIHRQPILYILISTMATYLGTTYGMGNWFINYMAEMYNFGSYERGLYMTAFVLLRVVGLFTGGFIADRLGLYRSMIIYAAVAMLSLFGGTILGRHGLWLISASGLAFAVVYPGVVTTVKKVFPKGSAYAMGFILTGATLIAMLISGFMGVLNSYLDAYRSFFMLPLCMFITFLLCIVIKRHMATKPA